MKIIYKIFLYLIILNLAGCSGCSKSGRESIKNNSENKYANKRERNESMEERQSNGRRESLIDKSTPNSKYINATLGQLYAEKRKSVFLVFATNNGTTGAQGTGFFVSSSGLGVSNKHVFDNFSKHIIKLYDGTTLQVSKIVRQSEENDYIIFKVDMQGVSVDPLSIAKQLPNIGDEVFAIGNPKGLEQTLSKGIVSSIRKENRLLQTTAEITNGSSGGPLFNMQGEVVGITTSGVGEANLNFAVNIQLLKL